MTAAVDFAPMTLARIQDHLRAAGFTLDAPELIRFITRAIELREESKFLFTKNVSTFLEMLAEYGADYGFSRDDLSFARVDVIYDIYRSSIDARDRIERAIDAGRASYAITCGLQLPFLITKPDDVLAFRVAESVPNFVTQGRVTAAVATNLTATSITGRIVLIESADPGYDWIFAHGPAGLITAFGGTNSHMAIRANELALPAVVGVGEKMYRRLAGARAVTIDCAERRVFPT